MLQCYFITSPSYAPRRCLKTAFVFLYNSPSPHSHRTHSHPGHRQQVLTGSLPAHSKQTPLSLIPVTLPIPPAMTKFTFGSFDAICERAALTMCPMLGTDLGISPTCYGRNVVLGSQIIFQPGKLPTPLSHRLQTSPSHTQQRVSSTSPP